MPCQGPGWARRNSCLPAHKVDQTQTTSRCSDHNRARLRQAIATWQLESCEATIPRLLAPRLEF